MKSFQNGFTLIELVIVIAILGILTALVSPRVIYYLGAAKEQAYNVDKAQIQAAVDAYYSSPTNTRFLGQRQYPIKAMTNGGTSAAILLSAVPLTTALTALLGIANSNPVGGTIGGTPTWVDSDTADGSRAIAGEVLWYADAAPVQTGERWKTTTVSRNGVSYVVDSRDWFIDFNKLVTINLLSEVPESASADNLGGITGSYSWYVNSNGKVQSLLYFYPNAASEGYKEGIYP